MIRLQRSGRTKNGKLVNGIMFAKEIAEYLNSKYAPLSVQVFAEQFGNLGTIYWYLDYKDLATLESVTSKLIADQEYLAIALKGMELFIEGSIHDCLMASV